MSDTGTHIFIGRDIPGRKKEWYSRCNTNENYKEKTKPQRQKWSKCCFLIEQSVFLGRKNGGKVCGVATSFSIFNFAKHSVRCKSAPHLTHDRTESENQWWMLSNQYYQSQDVKHNVSISYIYSFPKLLLILIPISIHCLPSVPIYVLSQSIVQKGSMNNSEDSMITNLVRTQNNCVASIIIVSNHYRIPRETAFFQCT